MLDSKINMKHIGHNLEYKSEKVALLLNRFYLLYKVPLKLRRRQFRFFVETSLSSISTDLLMYCRSGG